MLIVVIDGMGGGIGTQLVAQLSGQIPAGAEIVCVGANAWATQSMLKAGASRGATGENAVRVTVQSADIVTGPIGIIIHLLANRNIARNPQNANQFPGSIPHRRFDRFHQHPFAAIRKHNPFLIYTGPAREHRLAVMLPERIRQFFIDKIIIGLANNFFFPGAKKPFKRRIAG